MLRPVIVWIQGRAAPAVEETSQLVKSPSWFGAIGRNLTACELFPCVLGVCANPCLLCMFGSHHHGFS
jgi:hypothetical protein